MLRTAVVPIGGKDHERQHDYAGGVSVEKIAIHHGHANLPDDQR
ncbi:hypothetical protein [Tsuneonella flava]|nr:hypothetical protein [Tsuneonella flava]